MSVNLVVTVGGRSVRLSGSGGMYCATGVTAGGQAETASAGDRSTSGSVTVY